MSKKVTSRNLKVVMERLTDYALATEDESRQAFCHDLNLFLDELSEQDAFGTEGQCDPRESGRKGGLVTGVKRRAATFEKVKLLTPMQAYRKGRMEGWHAGHRNAMARIALDAS